MSGAIDLCPTCGCPYRPGWGMCICGAPRPVRLGGMGFIDPARVDQGQDAESVGGYPQSSLSPSAQQFRASLDAIARQPSRPSGLMIVSPTRKEQYDFLLLRVAVFERLLAQTPRQAWVRRYWLRRMLGRKRLEIIWPWAARKRSRLRWAWIEWKHRNDPEWQ